MFKFFKLTNIVKRCRSTPSLSLIIASMLYAIGVVHPVPASAQTTVTYVQPVWIYESGPYSPKFFTSSSAAFADSAAQVAAESNANWTYSASNPHPDDLPSDAPYTYFDTVPANFRYDVKSCFVSTGTCTTSPDWGAIGTVWACPFNGSDSGKDYNSPSKTELILCAVSNAIPASPAFCLTCLGDPVYAGTGENLQVQTDYSASTGLDFTRTYRSTNGYFASVLVQTFLNNTVAYTGPSCYPSYYIYGGGLTGFYCFPYMSGYEYAPNVSSYQLDTADGRMIPFGGSGSAVTQAADVNERVTMLTVAGATEWQVHRDDDTIELYNASGNLIQKTLLGGQSFTFTYSTTSTPTSIAPSPGLLISQTDAFGHTLSWIYNSAEQMSQMTDPAGGIYVYQYNTSGDLASVTYPDSTSKVYEYNESVNTGGANFPMALTGITDESAVRFATFQYSTTGLTVNTQHAGGVDSYTFSTTPGSSASVTDPLGTPRTYTFGQNLSYIDDNSQTQPAASGSGTVAQTELYDANYNVSSLTDYNGNTTRHVYDLSRNLETSRTEAYGTAQARTIMTQWNATWRQPALITEANRTTAFTYNVLGGVLTKTITDTTVTPNVTRTWTYTYDTYGRMLTADGPRTDVVDKTTYGYYTCTTGYQCGEIQTITDAAGHVWTFNTYNAHGQPLTVTDPNGVVTTLTYDARLRLLSRQVGTETTSYIYYPTGLLKLVTMPDSSTVLYTYDNAHRLDKITDGAGNYISYTLDNMGNHKTESSYDPSGTLHRTHTRVFSVLNTLYQDINAAGTSGVTTTLGYDNDGNPTSIAAPLTRNTGDQFDALNRLTQITDPNSGITKLSYDAENDLLSVTDPRSIVDSYTYNGFGQMASESIADVGTGTANLTYDSGGNLATYTDQRGAVATYSYDALNRPTSAAYKKGSVTDQTISYTYDSGTNGKGRLTGASDATHSMSWTYDPLGRVNGKSQSVAGVTKSVGYAYVNGDLTTLVTPSGQTVTYTYSNHRVTSIVINSSSLLSSATYEPFGPAHGWTWGNSTAETKTYNFDGNPSQLSALESATYSYDNALRINGISNTTNSGLSWTYGYDLLDRLTSGVTTGRTQGFTYDADGNRTTETGTVPGTYGNSPASNRLNSITGTPARTYTFDQDADELTYASTTLTYNDRDRLATATVSGTITTYTYNALGQRIEKTGGPAGTILFVYDEAGHLLGEYTSGGALIEETVWMGDTPVATILPNGTGISIYYIHADHLNSPKMISRPSDNAIMWRWDQDPFGSVSPNQNPGGLGTFNYNLRFPGQYYDQETGLFYNYFRDYDPQTGRYVESDPIGLDGGSYSTYAYAAGNPISLKDPSGLLVVGSYNTATGQLYMLDLDTGHSVTVQAASGGNPFGDPIPSGTYDILERAGRDGFYRLDKQDSTPYDDIDDATGRDHFRLHHPGRTIGCIAAATQAGWAQLDNLIKNTQQKGIVPDNFRPWWKFWPTPQQYLVRYGSITVR